ncbi:MAG: translation initiation factor IF-2 [Pirellulaceae bacterium]
MPIRIYALAKELKIDSKELVDICTKAGISGKGSALASLDDAESEKVKAFLSGANKKTSAGGDKGRRAAPAAEPAAPVRYTRDDYIAPATSGKVKVITGGRPSPAAPVVTAEAEPKADVLAEAHAEPQGEAEAEVIAEPKTEVIAEPKTEVIAEPKTDASAELKTDASAEPKVARKPKSEPAAPTPSKPRKKRTPVISLAKMPDVKQPTGRPKTQEPAPQKPDIRLPKDAIAGHKKGSRAPLEHLTKMEKASKSPLAGKGALGDKKKKPTYGAGEGAPVAKTAARGRRGTKFVEAEDGPKRGLAGMASARVDRQKARKTRAKGRARGGRGEDDQPRYRRRRTLTRKGTNTAAPRKGKVALELPCTVRSFSEAAGVPSAAVQRTLLNLGVMANINARIEDEMVEMIATELDVELEFKQKASVEDTVLSQLQETADDDPAALKPRPPIITFLGHVDHGKTSLLDRIIGTDVVSGEAGGITQHIRAYKIIKDGREIAFVDTPGHEAFTEMRARGANVTDIAVLVVAADDGVMPQTEEAISHARAAGVPIVVALNKMDLPGADLNKAMQDLASRELLPSEWGGDIEVVKTSATTGEGIDELLETLLTIAELNEYEANPDRRAVGICLEAEQEVGRGVIAKFMVQNGCLNVGDVVVCGTAHGRVKAIYDTLSPTTRLESAGPSTPVNVTGLDIAPEAGNAFYAIDDIVQAREIAETRAQRSHAEGLSGQSTKVSFERFQEMLSEGRIAQAEEVATLNLIIRADVQGSIEAILKELGKLQHPEVQIRILQHSVGGITTGDVQLANASNAVIIGFNVIPDETARPLAEDRQIEIRRYDVIYKLTDDIRAILEGKLKPEERVVELGRALVKQVFPISRVGTVAGCYVAQGTIERGCRVRVNRDGRTIGDYAMDSLRREKDDTKEVPRGMECGIKLVGFNDMKQDDILEAYKIEEVARTL